MKQLLLVLLLSSGAIALTPWASAEKTKATLITQTFEPAAVSRDRRATLKPHVFTLQLPARAGEQFSMLSLSLQTQNTQAIPIPFDIKTAQVAVIQNGQTRAIAIQHTWIDETSTVWLEFKPALPPKTQLTLSLNPHSLPTQTLYDYGIAAYANTDYPAPILLDRGTVTIR